jgi:hypothetical protein
MACHMVNADLSHEKFDPDQTGCRLALKKQLIEVTKKAVDYLPLPF